MAALGAQRKLGLARPASGLAPFATFETTPSNGEVGVVSGRSQIWPPLTPPRRERAPSRGAVIGNTSFVLQGQGPRYTRLGRSRAWRISRSNESSQRSSRPTLPATAG